MDFGITRERNEKKKDHRSNRSMILRAISLIIHSLAVQNMRQILFHSLYSGFGLFGLGKVLQIRSLPPWRQRFESRLQHPSAKLIHRIRSDGLRPFHAFDIAYVPRECGERFNRSLHTLDLPLPLLLPAIRRSWNPFEQAASTPRSIRRRFVIRFCLYHCVHPSTVIYHPLLSSRQCAAAPPAKHDPRIY